MLSRQSRGRVPVSRRPEFERRYNVNKPSSTERTAPVVKRLGVVGSAAAQVSSAIAARIGSQARVKQRTVS
jgi:hypothetical protein